jgi:hypothetical protein
MKETDCGFFQQDGATADTLWSSVSALQNVFRDQVISHPLWTAHSPALVTIICGKYEGQHI